MWTSLEFKRSDHSLNIYNPTEYYVVFAGLAVDKTDLTSNVPTISAPENINSYHFLHLAERTWNGLSMIMAAVPGQKRPPHK